jgi:hypothetical protein
MATAPFTEPLDADEPLFTAARLGVLADSFLRSDLGRKVAEKADREIQDCMEALLDVGPEDVATIRQLQFKAAVARSAVAYLVEIVQEGRFAEAELD